MLYGFEPILPTAVCISDFSLPTPFLIVQKSSRIFQFAVRGQLGDSHIPVSILLNFCFSVKLVLISCLFSSSYNCHFLELRTENPCVDGSNPPLPILPNSLLKKILESLFLVKACLLHPLKLLKLSQNCPH